MWCGGSGDDVEGFTWKAALLLSFGSSQPKVVPRSSPSGAKVRSKFLLKIPEFLEILVQHPPPTPTLPLSGLISVVLEFYHRKSQQWCLLKTETQMTNHSFKGHWGPSPGFATESFYDLGHTQPLWGPQFPHM